jgi:hypothetical protein
LSVDLADLRHVHDSFPPISHDFQSFRRQNAARQLDVADHRLDEGRRKRLELRLAHVDPRDHRRHDKSQSSELHVGAVYLSAQRLSMCSLAVSGSIAVNSARRFSTSESRNNHRSETELKR